MIGKIELAPAQPCGEHKPHVMEQLDYALNKKLTELEREEELRIWPSDGEKAINLLPKIQSYLRKHWPQLRVRHNCGADFVRIGYVHGDRQEQIRKRLHVEGSRSEPAF